MIGPQFWKLILSASGITAGNVLALLFSWLPQARERRNYAPIIVGCLLYVVGMYFMLKTALTDPGYIAFQREDEYAKKYLIYFRNYLVVGGIQGQKTHAIRLRFC